MKSQIFTVFAFATLFSCGKQESKMKEVAPATVSMNAPPEKSEDQIIKTANYRFQVENIDQGTKEVEQTVGNYQGSIANMNLESNAYDISNQFVIRVPSKNFELLLEELGKRALYIDYKRISTKDVTEEYIDIETRLKTKREVRDRYIDILKTKAKTVEDVLKAEEQIRIIQEEIEAKEGRLKYLQDRVSTSTVNLEIYQKVEYKETPNTYEKPYITKIKQGFVNGWDIVKNVALLFINLWPVILVGGVLYWRRSWLRKVFGGK